MQIRLSESAAALASEQAALSGYGTDIGAYVSHLIVTNHDRPSEVNLPRNEDDLVELLQEGLQSGIAERSWDDLMRDIKQRIAVRIASDNS